MSEERTPRVEGLTENHVASMRTFCEEKLEWIEEEIDKLFHQIPIIEEMFEGMTGEKLEHRADRLLGIRRLIRDELDSSARSAIDCLWETVLAEEDDVTDYLKQIPQVAKIKDPEAPAKLEERKATIKEKVLSALTDKWERPSKLATRLGLNEYAVRNALCLTAKPDEFSVRQGPEGFVEYAAKGTPGAISEERLAATALTFPRVTEPDLAPVEKPKPTIRETVIGALSPGMWKMPIEIAGETGLTEQQVKSVFYSPAMNGQYAKKMTDSGMAYAAVGTNGQGVS